MHRRQAAARDWTYLSEIAADTRAWMNPEAQWEERELAALYGATLMKLRPRCRQAFVAVREHGQSYAEAARTLGTSEKMIGKFITEAQRVFRAELRARGIRVPREKRSVKGKGEGVGDCVRQPRDTTRGRLRCTDGGGARPGGRRTRGARASSRGGVSFTTRRLSTDERIPQGRAGDSSGRHECGRDPTRLKLERQTITRRVEANGPTLNDTPDARLQNRSTRTRRNSHLRSPVLDADERAAAR